jgi:predicted dehydrogenase
MDQNKGFEMVKQINIGVVGLGSMGRNHVRVATINPFVKNVYVFDANRNAIDGAVSDFGVSGSRTLEELFELSDAVIIASATSSHYEVAMQALSHERHCLVEKPITETLSQAQEILELATCKKCIVSVGHIERFNPVFVEVCNILKSEKAYFFTAERLSYNIDRANDVSVILDLMIHDLDAMNYLSGGMSELKSCIGNCFVSPKYDFVTANFASQSSIFNLTASKVSQTRNRKLKISCEDCFIEADYIMRQVVVTRNGSSEYLQRSRQVGYKQQAIIEQVLVPSIEPLLAEQVDFLKSIIEMRPPSVSVEDGISALSLALSIESALKS